MRVALLTTDGPPARRCAQVLAETYDLAAVIVRTKVPSLPFETSHPFDAEQTAYESETWFGGTSPDLGDFASVAPVLDMTEDGVAETLRASGTDVAIVLDGGPVGTATRDLMGTRMIVLHGADPQDYRGEDVHLWATYHGEENRLECVVQQAAAEVNTGPVLFAARPDIPAGMALRELRRATTDTCITGAMKALHYFANGGMLSVNQLHRQGKLYSPMPAALKDYCISRFTQRAEGAS